MPRSGILWRQIEREELNPRAIVSFFRTHNWRGPTGSFLGAIQEKTASAPGTSSPPCRRFHLRPRPESAG